jgi:uncharacterized protein (TIGR02231 family)
MKHACALLVILISVRVYAADNNEFKSSIDGVRVYQNQAKIERTTKVKLVKGENTIVISGLPMTLYDWSIKSSLPKEYDGRIMSVEVEQKMLVERFQKRVGEIEDILRKLRDRDQEYIDALKSLKSQDEFIESVLNFTKINASKELQTRIPQIKVWDETLTYSVQKKRSIADAKRKIEKEREELGKEIQKWEFELSQIAGDSYFQNYQVLNKAAQGNVSKFEVQQYADSNAYYGQKQTILKRPTQGTDIEKRLVLKIFSAKDAETEIDFSYLIPNTYWSMTYDIRASRDNGKLDISLFGNVYQKTGEDWNKVKLALSTGAPTNSIATPGFYAWYLDIIEPERYAATGRSVGGESADEEMDQAKPKMKKSADKKMAYRPAAQKAEEITTAVVETGSYVDLILPLAQTIVSSDRYQKKFVKDFTYTSKTGVSFLYEAHPAQSRDAYLTAEVTNNSEVPWLPGEAQVFLENEFMGKVNIPYLPLGKKEHIIIGMEPRISVVKELVKKYEDTSGVFGGSRKIIYSYKITVESQMKSDNRVIIFDTIPVSRNEKISVEMKNQSMQFVKPADPKETKYVQGERTFDITMKSGKKTEISYDVEIIFDKKTSVDGLR